MPVRLLAPDSTRTEPITAIGAACVKFTAGWCGPCARIQPEFLSLLAKNPDMACYTVDVDSEPEIVEGASVTTLPTFVFLLDGVEVGRVEGADLAKLSLGFERTMIARGIRTADVAEC